MRKARITGTLSRSNGEKKEGEREREGGREKERKEKEEKGKEKKERDNEGSSFRIERHVTVSVVSVEMAALLVLVTANVTQSRIESSRERAPLRNSLARRVTRRNRGKKKYVTVSLLIWMKLKSKGRGTNFLCSLSLSLSLSRFRG